MVFWLAAEVAPRGLWPQGPPARASQTQAILTDYQNFTLNTIKAGIV